ncbi:MAG: arylamine N-acetyltransferase [Acidobacteriota bacterium]
MNPQSDLDLEAYCGRIRIDIPEEPTLETLKDLQASHLNHIPFENVDVVLRRGIKLDLESLQAKLVRSGRGGYCFEHNTLFAAVLRQLGFEVHTLEARVRPPGSSEILPRTHMVLSVVVEGVSWLADVGFGGDGPLHPVSRGSEIEAPTGEAYRVVDETDRIQVLQRFWSGRWNDLYAFSREPVHPVDFQVANHFTSTYPESIFLKRLTIQRFEGERRHILRHRTYTVRKGTDESVREVERDEVAPLVRSVFGLSLRDTEILRALDQNE